MKKVLIIICLIFLFTGCAKKDARKSDVMSSDIKVVINDQTYILKLENNDTAKELISLLPLEFTMNDLNNNEKYVYMNNSLTTNSYNPKRIEKGDVMLYGNNCLVIFYKSFDTPYSYTKVGHIDNFDDLEDGTIVAKFEIMEDK